VDELRKEDEFDNFIFLCCFVALRLFSHNLPSWVQKKGRGVVEKNPGQTKNKKGGGSMSNYKWLN
jgi:hypothetical protein